MFQLKKKNIVWWPVVIFEPVDGGKVTEHQCELQFELLEQDEFDSLANKGDRALMTRLIKGWKQIASVNDKELAFSQANLKAMLQLAFVRTSFLKAYMQAAAGAAVKN